MRRVTVMMVVIMAVIMATMRMIVRIVVKMGRLGVSAALGIERRLDLDHASAEAFDHVGDDMVTADTQGLGHDLGRQMPIAEMPGEPHQMVRIGGADLQQRLGGSDHLDEAAILEHERIATAQGDGVLQIEQECEAARAGHRHPSPVPVVEIEHDGVSGRLGPPMLSKHPRRANHAGTPILVSRS